MRNGWAVARAVLAVVWVIAAAVAWWTAPREVPYARASADVAAHRVAGYQWGDSWRDDSTRAWFEPARLATSGTAGPLFTWQTSGGRFFWTDTGKPEGVDIAGVATEGYAGPGAAALARSLDGSKQRDIGFESPARWAGIAGSLLLVASLLILVAGPAPVTGTRWFWLWLILLPSYGLGMLFWLVRERAGRPDDDKQRDRGWVGLCYGVAWALVTGFGVMVLHLLLGDRWVPLPGG